MTAGTAAPAPVPPLPRASRTGVVLLALHLLLAPLVFSVVSLEHFEYPKSLLLRATALALLAIAAARALSPRAAPGPDPVPASRDPMVWGAVAFLVSATLSTAFGISPRTSFFGAHERFAGLANHLGFAALFFATRAWARSRAAVHLLLWALLASLAGLTAFALLQLMGLDPISWARRFDFAGWHRPGSTLGNPNFTSAFIAAAAPACVHLAWRARQRGQRGIAVAILALVASALVVLTACLSRGAYLALAAAVLFAAAVLWRLGEARAGRGVVALVAVVVVTAGLWVVGTDAGSGFGDRVALRFSRVLDPARSRRAEFARLAVRMAVDHPILGVGPDAYHLAVPLYQNSTSWRFPLDRTPGHAHNEVLQVAAVQGVVGLATLTAFAAAGVVCFRRALARAPDSETRSLFVAAGAGIVALGVQGQFSFTVVALGALLATYLGMLSRGAAGLDDEPPPLSWGAAALLLAGAGGLQTALLAANAVHTSDAALPAAGAFAATQAVGVSLVAFGMWRCERGVAGDAGERPRVAGLLGDPAALVAPGVVCLVLAFALYFAVASPFVADLRGRLGQTYLKEGDIPAALAHLEAAVDRDGSREVLWVQLGVAHHTAASRSREPARRLAHLQEAQRAHRRAERLFPANPLHAANLARTTTDLTALGLATPDEVFAHFDRALALAPHSVRTLRDASRIAITLRRADRATDYAARCLEEYPQDARTRSLVGAAAMLRRDWVTAERELRLSTGADWKGDYVAESAAWGNLATALLEQGRPGEALAAAETALERRPDSPNAQLQRQRALAALTAQRARVESNGSPP